MFQKSSIDLKKAGSAQNLVLDYLEGKEQVVQFYSHPPSLKGFEALLAEKPYRELDRKILCERMNVQALKVENTSKATFSNITSLCDDKTFTVTTGHQLCLFTGPLYFIYKIATTVNLAARLNKSFPSYKFIPVYWMASEDHDFEEVNHFNLGDYTIRWSTDQHGAVGTFGTKGLNDVLKQLEEAAGFSDNGQALAKLFEKSYLSHNNLADATRFLVNELFGEHGLVTVDGNDEVLKSQFRNEFRDDIFSGRTSKKVNESIEKLTRFKYHVQVNPRDINVFLLEENGRFRLEKTEAGFHVVGTDRTLSRGDLDLIIKETPWKLSPNVTLRPLYQQKILPNLAYVGGPGELAYWLEYKAMFEDFGATFPVLMPRNFFTIVEPTTSGKLNRLGIKPEQLFMPVEETVKVYQQKAGLQQDTASEQESIAALYRQLEKKAGSIDLTLVKHVKALHQKHQKSLKDLETKFNRALRRQSETEIRRIKSAREALFPGGKPQERYFNFGTFYLIYGEQLLKEIFRYADPFSQEHIVLTQTGEK